MHWFCAIRAAKLKIMREMFPERPLDMVSNIIAHCHSQAHVLTHCTYEYTASTKDHKKLSTVWLPQQDTSRPISELGLLYIIPHRSNTMSPHFTDTPCVH